jgi:UTP--glucose-1-phosphate uridylyltransferase
MPAKVRKAVFPAAGLGTRFLPATKAQPKEMLPIVDKPIIQYGVEEAIQSGIQNIIIVTGRGKSAIEDHFDVSFELENLLESRGKKELLAIVRGISDMINVSYVRQKEALGLGHAVLRASGTGGRRAVRGGAGGRRDRGRNALPAPVARRVQLLRRAGAGGDGSAADKISAYGAIDAEPVSHNGSSDRVYRIRDLVEKPKAEDAPSNLAIIGRYVLTPGDFRLAAGDRSGLRRRNPIDRRAAPPAAQPADLRGTASRARATTPATSWDS